MDAWSSSDALVYSQLSNSVLVAAKMHSSESDNEVGRYK